MKSGRKILKIGDWVKLRDKDYHHYDVPAEIVDFDMSGYSLMFMNDRRLYKYYVLEELKKISKKERERLEERVRKSK